MTQSASSPASRLQRILPAALFVLAVLYVGSTFRAQEERRPYDLQRLGQVPVLDQGRVKPLDTLARTSLMILSNRQVYYVDGDSASSTRRDLEHPQKASAMRWILDVMGRPEVARRARVFRVDHPDLKALLGLAEERKYFAYDEVMSRGHELEEQYQRAVAKNANDRSAFERTVLKLGRKVLTYTGLQDFASLLLVPPQQEGGEWSTLSALLERSGDNDDLGRGQAFVDLLRAWQAQNPADFEMALARHEAMVTASPGLHLTKLHVENFYQRSTPFLSALALYVLVFILAALSWLRGSRTLVNGALAVLVVAVVLHTIGLAARIWLQGRPPVTNLYSSAIFVGWGAVLLGLFLERLFRNGMGAATAGAIGFITLLVAHNLSLDGDTMTMMQAVLDTNFWLATHVVVITLGYSATFLAGFLGLLYIFRGVFTRGLRKEEAHNLARMIYGIVAFATLFSFVGTILGGIWADQSWGRFWGWDPKENGALLIVLWNALILHARWGGMIRQRGLAVMAVAGNIVTAWSWFGTNMLGVGLHAYGFIDSAVFWMFVFVGSQLLAMGIGMLPLRKWRSWERMHPGDARPRPPRAGRKRAAAEAGAMDPVPARPGARK